MYCITTFRDFNSPFVAVHMQLLKAEPVKVACQLCVIKQDFPSSFTIGHPSCLLLIANYFRCCCHKQLYNRVIITPCLAKRILCSKPSIHPKLVQLTVLYNSPLTQAFNWAKQTSPHDQIKLVCTLSAQSRLHIHSQYYSTTPMCPSLRSFNVGPVFIAI